MGDQSRSARHDRGTVRGAQGSASVSSVLTPPTGLPSVAEPSTSTPIPVQRTSGEPVRRADDIAPTPPPATVAAPPGTCTCGHPAEAHEHYRAGDDCGACGAAVCAHYAPVDGPAKKGLLRRLGLRR